MNQADARKAAVEQPWWPVRQLSCASERSEPLSSHDATILPSFKVSHQMETSPAPGKDADACVICLSAVTEQAITVPCNHHSFDFVCLVSWLQQRSTCPLCQTPVTAVRYDWTSSTSFKTYIVPKTHDNTPSLQGDLGYSPYDFIRRARSNWRITEQPKPDIAIMKRRYIYQNKLYSLHVGSNETSGYRDVTPDTFVKSTELQSKAKAWIRRELRVFTFLHTDPDGVPSDGATTSSNAEFLISYIIAIMKKVDLKAGNGHAENLLQEFLGRENARLFLHELSAWMRSPYSRLGQWDRDVQYGEDLKV